MINMFFILIILLCVLFFIGYGIYKSRNNRVELMKKCGVIIIAVLAIYLGFLFLCQNTDITNIKKSSKPYIMYINETKSMSGTHIKLHKVFMDLLNLQATYSVWGNKKVVAIELKKNPEDIDTLATMPGLWVGRRIIPQYLSFSTSYSYKASDFVAPIYIIFYLSDGKSISFEIEDKMDVKSKVKIIDIDKTIKFDNSNIKFTKAYKGLNYSSVIYESDFMPSNLEITIVDGDTTTNKSPGWSGSGNKYSGDIWFDPIKSEKIQIKVKDKYSNKENTIDINAD
jgi:hypothetical protein